MIMALKIVGGLCACLIVGFAFAFVFHGARWLVAALSENPNDHGD